jgi:outer membrane protein OmpA-like peptidoglycan-associated protein/opacity protein-like surface antigen
MRSTIWALVAVLLVAAVPAFASGGDKGDWELGIYGGWGFWDDYGIFHPDDDNIWGLRFGHFFSPKWSLEASGQKATTDTEFEALGLANEQMKFSSLRLNVLYNLGHPGAGLRPFLTAGLGHEKVSVENYGESCDFGFNAGAGFRLFMGSHFNLRADGRYVRVKVGDEVDDSQSNYEATLGLNYIFGGHHEAVAEAAPPPPNGAPTVTCSADRSQILPGETVNITVVASDPEGDPLTYEWATSAGHVTGSGTSATLDFTGATPPATAAVTVRVKDNHGNAASSDCSVQLVEPVRKAEAVSCVAGGFPKNLSRISNVDKACLDDVAQRLSADPRARVVVIGNADSKETGANLAQQRADAVKTYLVRERNVDEARIEVRSAGSTKMVAAAGDAGNRRVEVWFVPEGAEIPGQ